MAKGQPPRHYWDSGVFLAYIDNEPGRANHVQNKLDECERGEVEIITSTVSITEVAYAAHEKVGRQLDSHVEEAIDAFWNSSPIMLVEFNPIIAAEARSLMRKIIAQGIKNLKPMDAIHLSTAFRMQAVRFETYDGPLSKYDAHLPFTIGEPRAEQESLFGNVGDGACPPGESGQGVGADGRQPEGE